MLTNPIDCPVCSAQHNQLTRLGQFNVIGCHSVTPTGNVSFFPKKFVVVVGSGLYVDESPPAELTPAQLQQRIDSLKAPKLVAAGKTVEELKAELKALEAP